MINIIVIAILVIWACLALRSIHRKKRLTSQGCSACGSCTSCQSGNTELCQSCKNKTR